MKDGARDAAADEGSPAFGDSDAGTNPRRATACATRGTVACRDASRFSPAIILSFAPNSITHGYIYAGYQ